MEVVFFSAYLLFWVLGGLTILLLGIFYYDRRYRRNNASEDSSKPQHGFHPTPEVFIDPKDGYRYRVYYNPYTGERDYIRE